jgi:hypothetical protein
MPCVELAEELWDAIVANMSPDDLEALIAIASTSRTLRALTVPVLFQTIRITKSTVLGIYRHAKKYGPYLPIFRVINFTLDVHQFVHWDELDCILSRSLNVRTLGFKGMTVSRKLVASLDLTRVRRVDFYKCEGIDLLLMALPTVIPCIILEDSATSDRLRLPSQTSLQVGHLCFNIGLVDSQAKLFYRAFDWNAVTQVEITGALSGDPVPTCWGLIKWSNVTDMTVNALVGEYIFMF